MNDDYIEAASLIVAAWAPKASDVGEICDLIQQVYKTLVCCAESTERSPHPEPIVDLEIAPIHDTDDLITCRECGRQLSMIKRHLLAQHDMTVDLYRLRHPGAPLTSASYSKARSRFARESGLGLTKDFSRTFKARK